jgi:asparagine synthase (glutamine-hydrolysing)
MQHIRGVGTLGFTRLAINGLDPEGMQPMSRDDRTWVCNGEIYNWKELAAEYGIENKSGSDCEILGDLYNIFCERGIPLEGLFRALDGVFAIIIVDQISQQIIVARDPYGVRPLYRGSR